MQLTAISSSEIEESVISSGLILVECSFPKFKEWIFPVHCLEQRFPEYGPQPSKRFVEVHENQSIFLRLKCHVFMGNTAVYSTLNLLLNKIQSSKIVI